MCHQRECNKNKEENKNNLWLLYIFFKSALRTAREDLSVIKTSTKEMQNT
jgi:hypothetical protein